MNPSQRRLRLGFFVLSSAVWPAGNQYLLNLFNALQSLEEPERPEIILLAQGELDAETRALFEPFSNQVVTLPAASLWARLWQRGGRYLPGSIERVLAPRPNFLGVLRRQAIDLVFSGNEFGPRFPLPLLAWIPDFQHRHLPQFFHPAQVQQRDYSYGRVARYADRVIVSSQAARRDYEEFAPEFRVKARVLNFVAQVPDSIYAGNPDGVRRKYHLPERFFFLPNQFWQHKNHLTVVAALSLAVAQTPALAVVCTGNANDERAPYHFPRLMAEVSRRNLRDNFIYLGSIPHDDLLQLLRQSVSLLQPSLFEGWSTIVEEAKSLGKGVVLSDLPVHREQDPPAGLYFPPEDAESLAGCLLKVFRENGPGPDLALEASARQALPERTRNFGRLFLKIAREAMG